MKKRRSSLECWSALTMLSLASARKPLTAAISPGRSGQASSRRVVGFSAIGESSRLQGKTRDAPQDPVQPPSGACNFVPDAVAIRTSL
jgi:hypothetical protein